MEVKNYDGMLQVEGAEGNEYPLSFEFSQRNNVGTYPNPGKQTAWMKHLMAFHRAHPNNSFTVNMKLAKKTYRKVKRNPYPSEEFSEFAGDDQQRPTPFQNPGRATAFPAYSLMANPTSHENRRSAMYGLGVLVALVVASKWFPRLRQG